MKISRTPADDGHRWLTGRRLALSIAVLILVIIGANLLGAWLADLLKIEITPRNEQMLHQIIMVSVVAYVFLIALPFVPGVEIGLALLVAIGPGVAPLIYGATITGLALSFLIGHLVPQAWLMSALHSLHLSRASLLIEEMEHLGRNERLALLVSRAPSRLVPFLLRHRYVALALALNLPGNSLIGGGGGISLLAGLSKLYSTPAYLATLAIAVAPVPLTVLIFGQDILNR